MAGGDGAPVSFDDMGLDPRLLKAIQKRGYESPTPVQTKCVPAALEGKDIVGLAKTGSGKTVAYLLPAVNKILTGGSKAAWQALILVPTRELCQQVGDEAIQFSKASGGAFGVTVLAHQGHGPASRAALAAATELVVATPARVAQSLQDGALSAPHLKAHLQTMVLDEADLLLSYGYEGDVRTLAPQVPRSCQCLLMSATTSADVDTLTQLVLHSPVRLDLTAGVAGGAGAGDEDTGTARAVDHHTVTCKNEDRLLNVLALLRLGLVPRKALIFVNSIDSGFRVKLFLEAFGVRAAVLNGELPLNSRHHILQEFNRGLFDYLVATDDGRTLPAQGGGADDDDGDEGDGDGGGKKGKKKGKRRNKRVVDGEFGVVRGVDFKGVRTVINFDLPPSLSSYVHRVGRTGRAGARGVAVTLLPAGPEARALEGEVRAHLRAAEGLGAGAGGGGVDDDEEGALLSPFPTLTKDSVEGLRYRGEDVARTVTKLAVREARAKELRLEILNSDRLRSHFEDNPGDLALLKHDKPLSKGPSAPHLKHVPGYLRDPKALPANRSKVGGGHVTREVERPRKRRREGGGRGGGNPLKTFKTSAFARAKKVGGKEEEVSAFEKTVMDGMWSKSTKKDRKVPGERPNQGVRKTNVRKNKRKRSR